VRPLPSLPLARLLLLLALLPACGNGGGEDGTDIQAEAAADVIPDTGEATAPDAADVVDPGLPIEASAAFRGRQEEYLTHGFDACGATECGDKGVICRVARGSSAYNRDKIAESLTKMLDRKDTADFAATSVLRLLFVDDDTGALLEDDRAAVVEALLGFTWWLDEPNASKMCFWSENHQILYHSSEYLVGQRWPDEVFGNSGMTGREHMAKARPKILRWLALRGTYGFSEWHSNVYFNEDIPAVANLADYADDPEIRVRAAAVLDLIALDLLCNDYKGLFATVHGRTYPSKVVGGLNDSTNDAAWMLTGIGAYDSRDDFSATFLATSPVYAPPPLLEDLAEAVKDSFEHRQRDSFDVAEGPGIGVGYEDPDDVVIWAGLSAIAAPEVIDGLAAMLDAYDLWEGFLFGDLPEEAKMLLNTYKGTYRLKKLATDLLPMSLGMALEAMDTYVYRTPAYQLAGAQDYKHGWWGTQTHIWQATIDRDAYTFVTFPGTLGDTEVGSLNFASDWVGGWYPRATMIENVGIFQYRSSIVPLVGAIMSTDHTHAYFDRDAFDEVVEEGAWVFGRKGEAYVGLWSDPPAAWSEDPEAPFERRAEGDEAAWVVELGSADEQGTFQAFTEALIAAELVAGDEGVRYASPSQGLLEVGWEGPLTQAGEAVDLGPYARWDNPYVQQTRGDSTATVTFAGHTLELDATTGLRRLRAAP